MSLAPRHRDHAAGEHPAGEAGDPRAADRGGSRGRDAAGRRGSPALAQRRPGVVLASLAAISRRASSPRRQRRRGRVLLGVGVIGLFIGIALLAPRLVKPLARVVGWPARRTGGVAGELAAANAVRNPGRTALTAAALMIGLTLVTVVAVLGAGMKGSTAVRREQADPRRLRRGRRERRAVPGVRGRRPREAAGRHRRLARPRGHRARRRRGAGDHRASTRPRSPTSTAFEWADGLGGRARTSARTAPSSPRATPTPRI